jgi:G6PDH family F420-dependent oxidoreductase
VERARLFTLPAEPPPIVVSAFGEKAAALAARIGDGMWSSAPDSKTLDVYGEAGGRGPRIAQIELCWAEDRDHAVAIAHRMWPNSSLPGQLGQELPTPTLYAQAVELVTPEMVAEQIPCGPDVEPVVESVRAFENAGYDHLHFHQIGPDQEGFFRFWEKELEPALG